MGDQRIGNYRVVRKLGEGGMGVVYECVHEYIGRRAAVKVLHADFSRNPEMAVRFLNEARATNIVQHPGIVNIFEFDRLPDGSAYIVMDYLDGDSLTTRLQKLGGKMDVQQSLIIAYQVADALSAAHAKNIVHRDLKPDNIMIVPDASDSTREQAKILDFGIAKIGETAGLGAAVVKTQIGVPMGTPLYMAPEQWKGAADVDAKSDVYSMGIIMFEMMSGQPPFIANSSSEVMALHILATPRLVTELNNQVPEELAFLINSMLAKLPADRPPMIQVVRELRRILGLGIENSLSGMRVATGNSGISEISSIRSGGIPASSGPPSNLRVSGIGGQGSRHRKSGRCSYPASRPWARSHKPAAHQPAAELRPATEHRAHQSRRSVGRRRSEAQPQCAVAAPRADRCDRCLLDRAVGLGLEDRFQAGQAGDAAAAEV